MSQPSSQSVAYYATENHKHPENSDFSSSIQRCPHDEENPYTVINNNLIRDRDLSFEARGFLIYLLSFDRKWKFSIPYFIKIGILPKNKMYKTLKVLIEAGYLKRDTYLDKGKKRYNYFVSENPKFKKCLLCPQKQDTEKQDPENGYSKEITTSSNEEDKNKQNKEIRANAPSLSIRKKVKEEKKQVAHEVWLTETQIQQVKNKCKNDPDIFSKTVTKLSDWKIGKGITGGKNDYKAFGDWVIDAVTNDEKKSKKTDQQSIEDRKLAERIWNKWKGRTDIHLGAIYIEFVNGPHSPSTTLTFGEKGFREKVIEQLKKRKLDIIGL